MKYKITLIILAFLFLGCKKNESPTDPGGNGGNTGTVTYEGKTYKTMKIGNQVWMAENLNVGTRINGNQDQTNNGVIEKYCYNDLESNCNEYGGLYQWSEAMQYSTTPGTRGICPPGWHIPTHAEFETLRSAVNDDGNVLKAKGQGTGAGAGTNTSGFSALLTGAFYGNDGFHHLGNNANFWSSTEINANAFNLGLDYNDSDIYLSANEKYHGFSVRCVKD